MLETDPLKMMNNDGVNEEREEVKRLRREGEAPWPDCPVLLCRAFGFWARRNTAGRRRKWGRGLVHEASTWPLK